MPYRLSFMIKNVIIQICCHEIQVSNKYCLISFLYRQFYTYKISTIYQKKHILAKSYQATLKFASHLPPSRCTYGKSDPLSLAQAQLLGSTQLPLQLHPGAFIGSFTLFETWTELQYVKPNYYFFHKLNNRQYIQTSNIFHVYCKENRTKSKRLNEKSTTSPTKSKNKTEYDFFYKYIRCYICGDQSIANVGYGPSFRQPRCLLRKSWTNLFIHSSNILFNFSAQQHENQPGILTAISGFHDYMQNSVEHNPVQHFIQVHCKFCRTKDERIVQTITILSKA